MTEFCRWDSSKIFSIFLKIVRSYGCIFPGTKRQIRPKKSGEPRYASQQFGECGLHRAVYINN